MQQIDLSPKPTAPATAESRWPHHFHHPAAWAIISLVVFVLILVAVFANHNNTKPKAPISSAKVIVSDSGFMPQTIHVKAGTSVSWTNQDARPHELAADPYPKNDSIPDFNNQLILQNDDTYSFIFSKAGTYHYHDQLNPFKFTGTVVVK
jgi:plastocyanin